MKTAKTLASLYTELMAIMKHYRYPVPVVYLCFSRHAVWLLSSWNTTMYICTYTAVVFWPLIRYMQLPT